MFQSTPSSRRFILSALLLIGPLSACNFKEVKNEETTSGGGTTPVDPNTPVSFAEIQSKILEPEC